MPQQTLASSKGSPAASPAAPSRGTIVIADDDPATLMLLWHVLSKAGFTVRACENGQLACEAVRREQPDVVLIDWMMPIMDGRAAVEQLKADPQTRGIPIIMLTTEADISERVVALEAGVQDFLTKPFDARELVARINQQMRWRKMLAIDANAAFTHDRLKLYRPEPGTESSIFDRIWSAEAKQSKKRR
jgi:DNA-binding response OmpR family regulator